MLTMYATENGSHETTFGIARHGSTPSIAPSAGGSKFGTLLVLTAMTAGGVYAYRNYFHRAGEDAVQLIPADALMVVTVDTMPSPGQTLTFKRIGDAIKAEHLDTQFEEALSRSLSNSPFARDLRPFASGSMAFATLKTSGARQTAGTGTATAQFFLPSATRRKSRTFWRGTRKKTTSTAWTITRVAGDTHCMAVIGSYLVTADKPDELTQMEAVRKGETPAIATEADYKQARAGLPADSNLMLFFSANGVSQAARPRRASGGKPVFPHRSFPTLRALCSDGHSDS